MKHKKFGEKGTYVKIRKAKPCDISDCNCNAAYDTKTINGSWANLCERHYKLYGIDELGEGKGQKYVISK